MAIFAWTDDPLMVMLDKAAAGAEATLEMALKVVSRIHDGLMMVEVPVAALLVADAVTATRTPAMARTLAALRRGRSRPRIVRHRMMKSPTATRMATMGLDSRALPRPAARESMVVPTEWAKQKLLAAVTAEVPSDHSAEDTELKPPTMAVRSMVLGAFVMPEKSPPGSRVCSAPRAPDHRLRGR